MIKKELQAIWSGMRHAFRQIARYYGATNEDATKP
jgi:hypothetical protein